MKLDIFSELFVTISNGFPFLTFEQEKSTINITSTFMGSEFRGSEFRIQRSTQNAEPKTGNTYNITDRTII